MISTHLKILLLEDNQDDVSLLKRELDKSGMQFTLSVVESKDGFVLALEEFHPDIILSDHTLPSFDSMRALAIVKERKLDTPFILITGSVSEEFAVECMKAGVDDYIIKSSLKRLPSSIENIFSNIQIRREKASIEILHEELKNAYAEIAEKNKNITDSILYAKRIQNAMLPDTEILNDCFSESFIYYMPRDIVSGDFYWFEQHHGKFILAVADCTGHGVPGALMSVIGIELLNKIVNERHITFPTDILRNLNVGVTRFFNQGQNDTTDGMDVAICVIDFSTNTLEYAGANRPLWFMRDNILKEIKPTKNAIGGAGESKYYKTHKINFEPNDVLYLFTDGIIDQFGGDDNKKLMKKRFNELLMSSYQKSMRTQGDMLSDFMYSWRGDNEQVDDMLAIGVKF